jgi:hypothetical protein
MSEFLTLAVDGGEWVASHPGRFGPGDSPRHTLHMGWLGSRTGLDSLAEKYLLFTSSFGAEFYDTVVVLFRAKC